MVAEGPGFRNLAADSPNLLRRTMQALPQACAQSH